MAGNVTQLPGTDALPDNPVKIDRAPWSYCSHQAIRLNEHARSVNCVKCQAVLDPFEFLKYNALSLQSAWQRHDEVRRKIAELMARVDALSKEEKRLRATVKRLNEKSGETVLVRSKPL